MGMFDNIFGRAEMVKEDDKIPMKPIEKPAEARYCKKVTVMWKDHTEVFDNASDITFSSHDLFYISFKDDDGYVFKKVYIPIKDVIEFDAEVVKL